MLVCTNSLYKMDNTKLQHISKLRPKSQDSTAEVETFFRSQVQGSWCAYMPMSNTKI